MTTPPLPRDLGDVARRALAEDLGPGDLTASLVPPTRHADATVVSREAAVLCGTAWFDEIFRLLDPRVAVAWGTRDGEAIAAGQILCTVHGPARAILTGERTALNFLQTLSGTATRARSYADAVRGLPIKLLDTRKTIPGLRTAQKYAVAMGGCHNHRFGLYDAILIKENHIAACGSITQAVAQARNFHPHAGIEVEVENLTQLEEALAAGVQRLLLDNMELALLRQAVQVTAGRARLEASGGVTLENVRAVAETGVDYISLGHLTKDVCAIDLSMRFAPDPRA